MTNLHNKGIFQNWCERLPKALCRPFEDHLRKISKIATKINIHFFHSNPFLLYCILFEGQAFERCDHGQHLKDIITISCHGCNSKCCTVQYHYIC